MKQTEDWLDNLKLRVSYGSVGNARVNSYWRQDYKMESSANRQYYLNETVQSALKLQNTLRNENLTWETKLSSNVGIDASLFNSRLNVTVDFYNDITKDLILRMDLPSNSGYEYQYQNVGRSTNRGVELTLSGTIINSKDFYLEGTANPLKDFHIYLRNRNIFLHLRYVTSFRSKGVLQYQTHRSWNRSCYGKLTHNI